MKNLPLLFLGIFFCLAFSWMGLILSSEIQIGGLKPVSEFVVHPDTEDQLPGLYYTDFNGKPAEGVQAPGEALFPQAIPGEAQQGRLIYIDQGCLYCHSQQVRRKGYGADFERGWGNRQTVARDYILQPRVLLGTSRTGPDLMAVGDRLPSTDWHYLHLYNPQITSEGSIMPPYRYLFETREIGEVPSPDALKIPDTFPHEQPPAGYEIIPTERARQLVAYLQSLKLNYELPESRFAE